jgi:uncharacterized membrane protein
MTAFQWSPPQSIAVYFGLMLALLAFLVLARIFARSPTARSWWLFILRLGVLAVLLTLLLNPVRTAETRLPPTMPQVFYLVDCSRSMALDKPLSRLEQVKQAIEQTKRRLPAEQHPQVQLYRFGQQLAARDSLAELQADEDATHLLEALERLPARFNDGLPGGVVIFSDGRTTDSSGFDEVAAGYRRLGVPLHVFPVGDTRIIGDVAIQEVIAPRDAPAGARLPVRVQVRSKGYSDRRTELRIRSLADPKRKPLATLPITLKDGQQTHELVLEQDPTAGKLVVEVPPFEGEAIVENNQVPIQIGSRKTKIRVIYMEGTLNNEYHWVRDALVEDPNIECLAMEVNFQYAAQPTLHRVNDPQRGYPSTREELFSYDVVICSDISRMAFTQAQLDWTVELVHKRGGGFAMVGGNTSFGAGFWDRTVWDGLVPIDMSGQAQSPGRGTCWGLNFRVKVPRDVERHPIWRIVDDPVKNRQILDQMPPFTGSNLVQRLKPAATALGLSDQPLPGVGIMPVFSCEPYGKGRTFAMSTDTTDDWGHFFERNWGEGGDNRYFRKFWRNVVQWLAENTASGNRRLRVETDKVIYRPDQPIKVTARAYDDKLEETDRYRLVARLRASEAAQQPLQEVQLAPGKGGAAYESALTIPSLRSIPLADAASPLRVLALDVTAYEKERVVAQEKLDVQVLDDPVEFQDPQPDVPRMEALAQTSGGKVLHNAEELTQVLQSFPRTPGEVVVSRTPVWDHPALWLLLVALLAVEWSVRRLWGLA